MPLMNPFDGTIMSFVQSNLHNPITDTIFPILTYLGEAGIIWILASVLLLFFRKYRRVGILALIALLLTFLTGELIIKNIVCRPRPCNAFPDFPMLIARPHSFSFPSGHSGSSFAAATVFFLSNKKWGIAAIVLASLIAFSRIFLFVHYPSDVLAGMLLGILFGSITVFAYRLFRKQNTVTLHKE